MSNTIKYLTVSISVRDKYYLCDVLDLFFLVSDKNNKAKKKSEAAKAYVSASESDSDEHEVVSI